jgi:hypothetical protein
LRVNSNPRSESYTSYICAGSSYVKPFDNANELKPIIEPFTVALGIETHEWK